MDKILVFIGLVIAVVTGESWRFAGVNIAQGKSTTQTPGTYEHYTSDLAVDGNSNSNFEAESCMHTDGSYNTKATWTVYLNGSYTLKGIRMFNRCGYHRRLKNFRIVGLPSSTILHDDAISIPQLYNDARLDVAIDSVEQFSAITIEIPAHTGDPDNGISFLTLCEVQIYSENHDCSVPSLGGDLVATLRNGTGYLNTAKDLVSTWTVPDFRCNGFYSLEGSEAIICAPGGVYNASVPTCTVNGCPLLNETNYLRWTIRNGSGESSSTHGMVSSGTVIDFACINDYSLVGTESIVCLQTGAYNTRTPHCTDTLAEKQRASYVGEIAGGVFGGFVVGIVVTIATVWLIWKRKQPSHQQRSSSVYMKPNPAFSSNIDDEHTYTDLEGT